MSKWKISIEGKTFFNRMKYVVLQEHKEIAQTKPEVVGHSSLKEVLKHPLGISQAPGKYGHRPEKTQGHLGTFMWLDVDVVQIMRSPLGKNTENATRGKI